MSTTPASGAAAAGASAGAAPAGAAAAARTPPTRVVQMNVFEDGLTDAPGAIGLSPDFSTRFNTLLEALSDDGAGRRFLCLRKARDFTVLPSVAALTASAEFFGYLDLVYNVLYHPLGGEARLAEPGAQGTPTPAGPDLANCLRTLFLCTTVDGGGRWSTPRFEAELDKAVGGGGAAQQASRARIEGIRERVFDADHGALGWDRSEVEVMWKRGTNLYEKWSRDLRAFLAPGEDAEQLAALSHLCRHGEAPIDPAQMESFIYVQVDASGAPQRVTSLTLHSAVRLLLLQLCQHSLQNDAAAHALCDFLGADAAPPTAELRSTLVASALMVEVEHWSENAALPARHGIVCETIAKSSPDVITAVEFDGQWRRLPLPTNRPYVSARLLQPERGCGQATILYDSSRFEPVDEIVSEHDDAAGGGGGGGAAAAAAAAGTGAGGSSDPVGARASIVVPGVVRSAKEQGKGESEIRPKSSCMLLLRRRCEGESDATGGGGGTEEADGAGKRKQPSPAAPLLLVCAVHLESAQPSDTRKVSKRREQLRALLLEVSGIAQALLAAGSPPCTVAIGGDFNAIREEFVHGNSEAFFTCPGTQLVRPTFRPPVEALRAEDMGTAIATLDNDNGAGPLRLLCEGIDGGELVEATIHPAEQPGVAADTRRVGCTRAGKSMVIDFIFCGVVGGADSVAGGGAGETLAAHVVMASDAEVAEAADESYGVRNAVVRWGSDHLPVACDIRMAGA